MASSKRDFERFVAWLHLPATQAPADVKRLANLALTNFDELAQTSRQHSQRSIYLVGRARGMLAQTPDGPPDITLVKKLLGRTGSLMLVIRPPDPEPPGITWARERCAVTRNDIPYVAVVRITECRSLD